MAILGVKSAGEVIIRYLKLSSELRLTCQDYYNKFLVLAMLADENEQQQQYGLKSIERRLKDGDKVFPQLTELRLDLSPAIVQSLERKDGKFTQDDWNHLTELEQLVNYANNQAVARTLTHEVAKEIYSLLYSYLYGKPHSK